ncbi:MAG: HupE/UreJ family protein, partial [Burkholderiales bacterium]|nr:HupE/UreJ family protein [Burkholderiales bacterium]
GEGKRWAAMGLFTKEGVKHIWGGADHLLFLLTLLLPGLMLIKPADPSHASGSIAAWKFALKVITAFTLAHSITLACSVLGWVSLPDRFIESMIALSIMVSAALNLQNRFTFSHWKLAFVFGLIHGMGFANGLKELGLSSMYFLETLFAFNLGVELGQLSAVVLVALPVVFWVKSHEAKAALLRWGSGIVFLIALVWWVQRLFG